MFGESINGTPQTMRGCSCIITHFAGLTSSMVFTLQRKTCQRTSCGIRLIPLTCADLARPCGFCWIQPWLLIEVWCFLLVWIDGILIMKNLVTPKNYFSTGPQPSFPINLLPPQALVNGLEEKLKHSRTLNEIGLEKSKLLLPNLTNLS